MTATSRRALLLANIFNLLVAIYFIIISIVSLIKLRWYHQLTITIRIRHVVTTTTSYFAFLILLSAAIIFITIFLISLINSGPKVYTGPSGQDAIEQQVTTVEPASGSNHETLAKRKFDDMRQQAATVETATTANQRFVIKDSSSRASGTTSNNKNNSRVCCSILLHLISAINLLIILLIWLLNTGELVRDSISSQLDQAFVKYQFANRSNHYSIAIDGMQDINNCCGSLDYTDFPHQRISGLSSGHYPGSCCGKNIFGVNARVHCVPEEIVHAKQTVSN